MFTQPLTPIAGSALLSALLAALPLAVLFVLLGVFKVKAWQASVVGLVTAFLVATLGWHLPLSMAASSAGYGLAYGFFPILWILINAIWVYQLSVVTGWFKVFGDLIRSVSDDLRILSILIAFCFGALMEALAGFGAPVAISAAMLVAAGMKPVKAALVSLLANTAPVAFGAMGAPIIALSAVTRIDVHLLSSMAGRQTPFLAFIVPLILVFMVDGKRGVKQTWPVALVAGLAFGAAQFVTSNFIAVEITDVVAALFTIVVVLAMLRFWKPSETLAFNPDSDDVPEGLAAATNDVPEVTATGAARTWGAVAPYVIIIVIFAISQLPPVKEWFGQLITPDGLSKRGTFNFQWPGLGEITTASGGKVDTVFHLDHIKATGTLLLISGIFTCFVFKIKPLVALKAYGSTVKQLRWTIVTVASVLGLAFLMNHSGQTASLGSALANAGAVFALLSPVIGWIGVAITGSDTSANSLFGLLQVTAAEKAGLNPILMSAANSTGGVLAKMLSPQSLAVAVAAVGLTNQEGTLFRKLIGWSLGLLAIIMVLVFLQSTVLTWMIPGQ